MRGRVMRLLRAVPSWFLAASGLRLHTPVILGNYSSGHACFRRSYSGSMAEEAKKRAGYAAVDNHVQVAKRLTV